MTYSILEPLKEVMDWFSFGTLIATFFQLIPQISGLVGLIWLCIRVWETDTVQKLFKRKGQEDGNK